MSNKNLEEYFGVDNGNSEDNTSSKEIEEVKEKTNELADLDKHESEMDEISKKAIESFEEIMHRAGGTEEKDAGKMYTAANDLLKTALNARNSKVDARIKSADLAAKLKKTYSDNSSENEEKSYKISRAEILKSYEETEEDESEKKTHK